jgi:hypothetical protein
MTANTVQSRKGKGRKLQQLIRDKLLDKHKEQLVEGDIESRGMGQSGTDIVLSPLAQTYIPFDIEAKNQESISIWKCLEQAETNTKTGRIPLLVFKRARSKTYCCLEFDKLLELIR